jgi:hypothetical protein
VIGCHVRAVLRYCCCKQGANFLEVLGSLDTILSMWILLGLGLSICGAYHARSNVYVGAAYVASALVLMTRRRWSSKRYLPFQELARGGSASARGLRLRALDLGLRAWAHHASADGALLAQHDMAPNTNL